MGTISISTFQQVSSLPGDSLKLSLLTRLGILKLTVHFAEALNRLRPLPMFITDGTRYIVSSGIDCIIRNNGFRLP